MQRTLLILRGTSGSGKSTLATLLNSLLNPNNLGQEHGIDHAADHYFTDKDGNYKFDATKLYQAHKNCRDSVENSMLFEDPIIIVSNTNTSLAECQPYFALAKKYNYQVFSLIVENRHDGQNTHNVPIETLEKQEAKLRNSLKLR